MPLRICHFAVTSTILLSLTACATSRGPVTDTTAQTWPFATQLECVGTEPFWAMSLTPGRGNFQPMDGQAREFMFLPPVRAAGRTDIWTMHGHEETGSKSVVVTLHQTGQCSDGMSDFGYDYEIILATDGEHPLAGCCGRQE